MHRQHKACLEVGDVCLCVRGGDGGQGFSKDERGDRITGIAALQQHCISVANYTGNQRGELLPGLGGRAAPESRSSFTLYLVCIVGRHCWRCCPGSQCCSGPPTWTAQAAWSKPPSCTDQVPSSRSNDNSNSYRQSTLFSPADMLSLLFASVLVVVTSPPPPASPITLTGSSRVIARSQDHFIGK